MLTLKRLSPGLLVAVFFVACEPPKVEPELSLTGSPRTIDALGQKTTLRALATDDSGNPGTGNVRFTAPAGSLKAGEEVALTAGEAEVEFSCVLANDPGCMGTVRVTAEWVSGGKPYSAVVSITVTPPVVVVPDAGLTLTSSRSRIGIGLGNPADIVATYQVDGVPQAGTMVNLTTTEGQLVLPDGGAFNQNSPTDSNGQVRAVLVEDGMAGTATVTAIANNRQDTETVTIYLPDAGITIMRDRPLLTVGFNERSRIDVAHTLEMRAVPGRPIVLETTAGQLVTEDGGTFISPAVTDLQGNVRAYLTDLGAPGVATITARDTSANVSASTTVTLATPDAGVVVAVGRPNLYLGINDSVDVTASLYANGNPSANRPLNVTTSLGVLALQDGGVFSGSGTTDATGNLRLVLKDNNMQGTATITGTDPMSNRTGTANVSIRNISTVNFQGMTCGGTACTVLGISNSNFRTTGRLRFVVRDNQTTPAPVAGVPVSFTLNLSSALGTTIAPMQTVTDTMGVAEVNVNTGNDVGSFTVTATVLPGVAATSPSFGIRGAKPTNDGFTLRCDKTTMSAYTSAQPGIALPITSLCTASVVDRFGNPVGLATDVSFRAEAGSIPAGAQTPEFTTGTSANEGRTTVTFDTAAGLFPAADVTPLAAVSGQYPFALTAEPSRVDGQLTRNPRDGLVVIIAWTRGEEWFNDLDGNGVQNGNEPFIDQGEPFIDTNDNDVFDENDRSFNVDGDGVYTPPNGVWDANTFVWTKTYVLYTDRSSVSQFAAQAPATIPFNVAKGTSATFDVWMPDLNFNRIEAGSSIAFTRTAMKGTIMTSFANLGQDGTGFQFEPRVITNQAGTAACPTATDRICVYKTRFGAWGQGYVGTLTVVGAPSTDMTPAQSESIQVRTTTRGGTINSAPLTGTIQ